MEIKNNSYVHPGKKLRIEGASRCTERELLAIIINSGTKKLSAQDIADKLLNKYGNVFYLQGERLADIMEIEGIGPVKATQIAAVFELCQRILKHIEAI